MTKIYSSKTKNELEEFLLRVSESILQINASLFIGAGSSMQYKLMNWNNLMDLATKNLFDVNIDLQNTEKAQYAELIGKNIKQEICSIINESNIQYDSSNTYLHYLLDFDYNSIWTTNYDQIIENVLKEKNKNCNSVFEYKHFSSLSFPNQNFLFKINGSSESSKTIVITKDDFIDYRRTHEAYMLLLKRELLCHSLLFLGCSFDDDILRMCIKDINNCVDNSKENYTTQHYAIIVDANLQKLKYLSEDLKSNYNINCLTVTNPSKSYIVSYGISQYVKLFSVFISGAKYFSRGSEEENLAKDICKKLVEAFIETQKYKIISGMGNSIGHFISGSIKHMCRNQNINRFLQMEPFPFTSKEDNKIHRENILKKAGIFIFIYGDFNKDNYRQSGMWIEYELAKKERGIIIPLNCGKDSISYYIFQEELKDTNSFSFINQDLLNEFNHLIDNTDLFSRIIKILNFTIRQELDNILDFIKKEM